MTTIKVLPNQTLADVAIMACGTLEGAMAIMKANNQSLTDLPAVGFELAYDPNAVTTDNNALQYFSQNGVVIGTKSQ